ncbi:hypothetical protein LSH36_54g07007 [Paralvinella palmiformis]|uniref:MORN repeat-containing protein 2-like n=1 Tax=Paralvinella palmiformis TaxID=53620 RepID=A0AAD9K5Y9_9ANNE|nr:hypothetical protein LSH36_54g07007 [Paralvinella palmiformis]
MPAAKKKQKEDDQGPTILQGVYMFPNGDKYDGEYMMSPGGSLERSGTGKHITSDGTVYTGQWVEDKMHGQGKIIFPSGATYEGIFVNNQFQGRGKYVFPNGSFYDGEFNENKLEGDGNFTDTESQIWSGTFRYKAAPGLRFKLNL